jgi:hypothetical protein
MAMMLLCGQLQLKSDLTSLDGELTMKLPIILMAKGSMKSTMQRQESSQRL